VQEYDIIDGKEILKLDYDSMFYNPDGSLAREVWFMTFESLDPSLDVLTFTYNKKGEVVEQKILTYENGILQETYYQHFFYENEKISKSYSYTKDPINALPEDSDVYIYKNNRLVEWQSYITYVYEYRNDSIFEYNKQDHELHAAYINDQPVFIISNGSKTVYKFDSNGFVIGSTYTQDNRQTTETLFEYKNELLVKVMSDQPVAKKKSIGYYAYTYYP
jgi:hypothetical protein